MYFFRQIYWTIVHFGSISFVPSRPYGKWNLYLPLWVCLRKWQNLPAFGYGGGLGKDRIRINGKLEYLSSSNHFTVSISVIVNFFRLFYFRQNQRDSRVSSYLTHLYIMAESERAIRYEKLTLFYNCLVKIFA